MPLNRARRRRKMVRIGAEAAVRMKAAKDLISSARLAKENGRYQTAADDITRASAALRHARLDMLELHRLQGQGASDGGETPIEL